MDHLDPDQPLEAPHPTHAWESAPRWTACTRCGIRDHWPGSEAPCRGEDRTRKGSMIPIDTAVRAIVADVHAFRVWWNERTDLGHSRPSIEEWFAEYWEWRMRKR